MPARNVARPGDLTGRTKEALAKQNAEAVAARASEMSMISAAAEAERDDTVHEVMPKEMAPPPAPEPIEVSDVVEVETPMREFRVNTTLENVTFGAGNHFDFEEGIRYRAPKALYDHLDSLGYVWH